VSPRPFLTHRLLASLAVLALAAALLFGTVSWRGPEYDEQYTLLLVAGAPRPAWPEAAFTAATIRQLQAGATGAAQIARDLRRTDVHPPLYFWTAAAWHDRVGPGLTRLRLLSVIFALAALAMVGWIASLARIPPARAMAFTLGCYGFAYTAGIARGFALAQFLSLAGVALLLSTERRPRAVLAFAGGLALGAATLTNYLAAFVAGAALLWLLLRQPRAPRLWLAAVIGFSVLLPAALFFFLAQRDSRAGQFLPFELLRSIALLARFGAGAIFGGLPLYVSGTARLLVSGALGGLLAALSALIVWRWRGLARPGARWLLAMAALAPPLGLMLLGLAFDNTPIELRYLSFAVPFAALLLAGSLATLPRRLATGVGGLVLLIQAASLAGLFLRAETMQPARATAEAAAAAAWPKGVVLLPHGNDGVGIVAAFASEAPDWLPMLVVGRDEPASRTRIRAGAYRRVVLALLGQDEESRATVKSLQVAFAHQPCWRWAASGFNVVAYDRICGED
jgi:4-amino-4-deoxy-L-arabinose transferase-like glycosyltransferase